MLSHLFTQLLIVIFGIVERLAFEVIALRKMLLYNI